MVEQHMAIADRDDVVMKNPRVDRRRVLAGEDQLAGIDLIEARYRLAGLKGLPRRIATRRLLAPPAAARPVCGCEWCSTRRSARRSTPIA